MRYYQHPQIPEIATPSTPPSGTLALYAKTDGALYSKNDGGTEVGPYASQTYVDSGGPINAKNYLKGDGTLEVDANVTALMAAWLASRKSLYWPAGTYLVNGGLLYAPFDGCTMYGDGFADTGATPTTLGATIIKQNSNGVLFNASGTNTTTRRRYVTIRDLMFNGGDTTGSIVQAYYTTTLNMWRVLNYGKNGYGLDAVELWDSTFVKVDWEWCYSDTQYAVSLRNASAASGFGSSSDNTNATRFFGCRIETFKAGAVWIDAGVGTANLHDIAFFGLKVETGISRGTFIHVGNTCSGIIFNQLYCYIGGWDPGYTTPITIIQFVPSGQSTLRDVYLASGSDNNYVYRGVEVWSDDATLDNIQGLYGHASSPSNGHIDITGGTNRLNARAIVTNRGIQFNGTPASWAQDPTDRTNIQIFSASGTWTKPSNAKNVYVACVGGGGGGGSGRRDATNTTRGGGGGGGSAARSIMEIPASALGATETVTVGTGGAGGTGITANTTNGNVGTAGGASTFGAHVRAFGGGAGGGGTGSGGTAGTAGGGSSQGAAGGAGGTGAAGTAGGDGQMGGGAGGGGGGLSSGNTAFTGGAGGACLSSVTTGGTAGAINGTGGTGTASAVDSGIPGAGGGGGGASVNGQTSGAGGAGSGGIVVVICSTGS